MIRYLIIRIENLSVRAACEIYINNNPEATSQSYESTPATYTLEYENPGNVTIGVQVAPYNNDEWQFDVVVEDQGQEITRQKYQNLPARQVVSASFIQSYGKGE